MYKKLCIRNEFILCLLISHSLRRRSPRWTFTHARLLRYTGQPFYCLSPPHPYSTSLAPQAAPVDLHSRACSFRFTGAAILFPLPLSTPISHPLHRRPPRSPGWPFFCPFRFLLLSIFPSALVDLQSWVRHWKIIINICNWLHNYLYIFLYNLLYIRYFLHL